MMETGYDLPTTVVAALYVAVMAAASLWLVYRIVRYRRYVQSRRSSDAMMAQELSQSEFRHYLDKLRAERAGENPPEAPGKTGV
jgi:hypothetical protein